MKMFQETMQLKAVLEKEAFKIEVHVFADSESYAIIIIKLTIALFGCWMNSKLPFLSSA